MSTIRELADSEFYSDLVSSERFSDVVAVTLAHLCNTRELVRDVVVKTRVLERILAMRECRRTAVALLAIARTVFPRDARRRRDGFTGAPDIHFESRDGVRVPACRRAMRSVSPVFSAMFSDGFREAVDPVVKVEACPASLRSLVHFASTGTLDGEGTPELLQMADAFLADGLKAACEDCLASSLAQSNVDEMCDLAEAHGAYRLRRECLLFALEVAVRGEAWPRLLAGGRLLGAITASINE